MSVIIRLQNLSWAASALDIRQFFHGLSIPDGGVHIIGGENGDAFIAFSTDEDARQAMMCNGRKLNECAVSLLLSSKTEMQNVISSARAKKSEPTSATNQTQVPPEYPSSYQTYGTAGYPQNTSTLPRSHVPEYGQDDYYYRHQEQTDVPKYARENDFQNQPFQSQGGDFKNEYRDRYPVPPERHSEERMSHDPSVPLYRSAGDDYQGKPAAYPPRDATIGRDDNVPQRIDESSMNYNQRQSIYGMQYARQGGDQPQSRGNRDSEYASNQSRLNQQHPDDRVMTNYDLPGSGNKPIIRSEGPPFEKPVQRDHNSSYREDPRSMTGYHDDPPRGMVPPRPYDRQTDSSLPSKDQQQLSDNRGPSRFPPAGRQGPPPHHHEMGTRPFGMRDRGPRDDPRFENNVDNRGVDRRNSRERSHENVGPPRPFDQPPNRAPFSVSDPPLASDNHGRPGRPSEPASGPMLNDPVSRPVKQPRLDFDPLDGRNPSPRDSFPRQSSFDNFRQSREPDRKNIPFAEQQLKGPSSDKASVPRSPLIPGSIILQPNTQSRLKNDPRTKAQPETNVPQSGRPKPVALLENKVDKPGPTDPRALAQRKENPKESILGDHPERGNRSNNSPLMPGPIVQGRQNKDNVSRLGYQPPMSSTLVGHNKEFADDALRRDHQQSRGHPEGMPLRGQGMDRDMHGRNDMYRMDRDLPGRQHEGPGMNREMAEINRDMPRMNRDTHGRPHDMSGNRNVLDGNQDMPGTNRDTQGRHRDVRGMNRDIPERHQDMPGMNRGLPVANREMPGMNRGMPGRHQDSPGMNRDMPGRNRDMPGMNRDIPEGRQAHPGMNRDMPGGRQGPAGMSRDMPGRNQDMPGMNRDIPGGRQAHPRMNRDTPGGRQGPAGMNRDMPGRNQDMPGMNRDIPGGRQGPAEMSRDMPGRNQDMPGMNRDIPEGRQAHPGMNRDMPGRNQDVPGMNRDIPARHQDMPTMNRDVRGGNRNLPGINHDIPGLNRDSPLMNRGMPDMNRDAPGMNRDSPNMNMGMPGMNRDMPGMHRDMSRMPRDMSEKNMDPRGAIRPLMEQPPTAPYHDNPHGDRHQDARRLPDNQRGPPLGPVPGARNTPGIMGDHMTVDRRENIYGRPVQSVPPREENMRVDERDSRGNRRYDTDGRDGQNLRRDQLPSGDSRLPNRSIEGLLPLPGNGDASSSPRRRDLLDNNSSARPDRDLPGNGMRERRSSPSRRRSSPTADRKRPDDRGDRRGLLPFPGDDKSKRTPERDRRRDRTPDRRSRSRDGPDNRSNNRRRGRSPGSSAKVLGLASNVTFKDMRRFFSGCLVTDIKMFNKDSRRYPDGFAFVLFASVEDRSKALRRSGERLFEKTVHVETCTDDDYHNAGDSVRNEPSPPKRMREADSRQNSEELWVKLGNLQSDVTKQHIFTFFKDCEVDPVSLFIEYVKGNARNGSTGTAFLQFKTHSSRRRALGLHRKEKLNKNVIEIREIKGSEVTRRIESHRTQRRDSSERSSRDAGEKTTRGDVEKPQSDAKGKTARDPVDKSHRDSVNKMRPDSSSKPRDSADKTVQKTPDKCPRDNGNNTSRDSADKTPRDATHKTPGPAGSAEKPKDTAVTAPLLDTPTPDQRNPAQGSSSNRPVNPSGPKPLPKLKPLTPVTPPQNPREEVARKRPLVVNLDSLVENRSVVGMRNLPHPVTIDNVLAFLREFHPIPETARLNFSNTGIPTGEAMVAFPSPAVAQDVIRNKNNSMVKGNVIMVFLVT